MKDLKMKVLSMLAVMSFAVVSVIAQPPGGGGGPQGTPEERATAETEVMVEKLSLTDAQKAEVSAINLKYAEKQSEAMSAGGDPRTMMESIQTEKSAEINAILTDTQKTEYAKLVTEMQSQRGGGRR